MVATDVGGNDELIAVNETGYLVPRADPEAMAAAIRRYAEDPELRLRHGGLARARALQQFSIDAMTERYTAVYDEVVKHKNSPVSRERKG